MPLREISKTVEGEHESGEYGSLFNDISSCSFRIDDDFAELVWENGQIMVKSHCTKVSRAPADAVEEQTSFPKTEKFVEVEPFASDNSLMFPSGEMVPWLGYPFSDATEQQCSPEILPEVPGGLGNGFSTQNSSDPVVVKGNGDLHTYTSKASAFPRKPQLLWPPQNPETSGSRCSEFISNQEMESQEKGLCMTASKLVNFPHFSRHNTNLHKPAEVPNSVSLAMEKDRIKGKSVAAIVDTSELSVSPLYDTLNKDTGLHAPFVSDAATNVEQPVVNLSSKLGNQVAHKAAANKEIHDDMGPVESHIACSSRGIGHGTDVSCNQTNKKRKSNEVEVSESHSNENFAECVDSKRPAQGGSGMKRRRTAEVHNLSERRRRDRINEKMKELQELIPNSIKTDKASMLDQATEYLKMLKLQVQVMSMGGMCMVPMMFPPGMPPPPPMYPPHLRQMGVGTDTGTSAGVGIGAPDGRFRIPPMTLIQPPPHLSPGPGPTGFVRAPGPGFPLHIQPARFEPHLAHPNPQMLATPTIRESEPNLRCSSSAFDPLNPTRNTSSH